MSNDPQRRTETDGGVLTSSLSADVAFNILTDGDRRAVLTHLLWRDESTKLGELTTCVGSSDTDTAAASLHHLHLPKLDEAGLVDYDHEQRTVSARQSIYELEPLLEWAADQCESDGA